MVKWADQRQKGKAAEILVVDAMSSEESCYENDENGNSKVVYMLWRDSRGKAGSSGKWKKSWTKLIKRSLQRKKEFCQELKRRKTQIVSPQMNSPNGLWKSRHVSLSYLRLLMGAPNGFWDWQYDEELEAYNTLYGF